jgi:hypothetical protein
MPSRPPPADDGREGEDSRLRRKLADLVAKRRYRDALRVREQALRRRPELNLQPSEAQLWCLEGQQAALEGQPKRAEEAFRKAIGLGLAGDPLLGLARLWVQHGQTARALELMGEAFTAGRLPQSHAGAYLKLLFLAGEVEQVRALIRTPAKRFQPHQIQWAAGVLSLLDGDSANARRQFARMAGPPSPGDSGAVWRAWAALEAGDSAAALTALKDQDHPACAAVALDLAARTGTAPTASLDLRRRDLPCRDQALALILLHHLRQQNLLGAAQLLLNNERALLAVLPDLAKQRRTLLLLAGQQALEREASREALICWRPIVNRPSFDPDLALRLYPLLDESDEDEHNQEAERLVGQLMNWVRRAAQDDPSAWPEPLLSTTRARLHCWQADHAMRLGQGPQAHRAVEQARQLAPDLPDVIGRHGALTLLNKDDAAAIPLLWQALDGGCRARMVYVVLDQILQQRGENEAWLRLRRQHGASFGLPPPPPDQNGEVPDWLAALSADDVSELAEILEDTSESGAPLDVLRVLLEHLPPPANSTAASSGRRGVKRPLELPAASDCWDALLDPLPPEERVEPLMAILVAIQRFCRRSGKAITSQIALRQAQLERLAAASGSSHGERALRALLLLHGLRLKPSESPDPEVVALLRRAPQPQRTLPLALLDLYLFASTRPWRSLVETLHRQEPDNPLLTLALATMERDTSLAWTLLREKAFEQARRQQDSVALAACRRDQAWSGNPYVHSIPGRHSFHGFRGGGKGGRGGIDQVFDLDTILRNLMGDRKQEDDDAGGSWEDGGSRRGRGPLDLEPPPWDPPPRQRLRGQRRSFMDL